MTREEVEIKFIDSKGRDVLEKKLPKDNIGQNMLYVKMDLINAKKVVAIQIDNKLYQNVELQSINQDDKVFKFNQNKYTLLAKNGVLL